MPIPDEPWLPPAVPFPPGEAEALRRLRAFAGDATAPIRGYVDDRNRMDLDGTSQLSPYLRFGMVSAQRAAVAALNAMEQATDAPARQGAETWLTELIWREFYMAILHHFPHVLEQAFQERLRSIPWQNDEAEFAAWCEGRTGYPVVDAAMRQLVTTGWMHNRARMIVASFLVKDLLIDWRWGERFFMQHLVDGDPAANNGGWQWTAGVGTDAAPYFRVFNPSLQGAKFDPLGDYVRRWVPELGQVPGEIHPRAVADVPGSAAESWLRHRPRLPGAGCGSRPGARARAGGVPATVEPFSRRTPVHSMVISAVFIHRVFTNSSHFDKIWMPPISRAPCAPSPTQEAHHDNDV